MAPSRRTGLSCRQHPEPLLKTVGGKSRDKLVQKVVDDAQPLSSEDEDDEQPASQKDRDLTAPPEASDDSEPERGKISRTSFKQAEPNTAQGRRKRRVNTNKRKSPEPEESDAESVAENSRKRPKETLSNPISSSDDPHVDEKGFVKRKKTQNTYGSRKSNTSQYSSMAPAAKKAKPPNSNKKSTINIPGSLDSPKKSSKAKLSVPEDSIASPPLKKQSSRIRRPEQTGPDDGPNYLDSPQRKSRFKAVGNLSQDSGGRASPAKKGSIWKKPKILQNTARPKITTEPAGTEPRERKPDPPRPTFIIPASLQDWAKGSEGDSSPVNSLCDFLNLDGETSTSEPEESTVEKSLTTCPWCGDPVEEGLLENFAKGKRLNVRMQTKFCHRHKRDTAMDTWRSRHYPVIEWATLEKRLAEHQEYLLRIIDGEASHFRDVLAEKIKSGTAARSLKKEDDLNPGYYGPRGFNVMCDYLVGEFGDLLKEKATNDRVIAGRGSAAFIQSVLVAELAVRLIEEDMDVSTGEARIILEESKPLGEIINEEP